MQKDFIIIDTIGYKILKYQTCENMEWELNGLLWDYQSRGIIIQKNVYNNGYVVALKERGFILSC